MTNVNMAPQVKGAVWNAISLVVHPANAISLSLSLSFCPVMYLSRSLSASYTLTPLTLITRTQTLDCKLRTLSTEPLEEPLISEPHAFPGERSCVERHLPGRPSRGAPLPS